MFHQQGNDNLKRSKYIIITSHSVWNCRKLWVTFRSSRFLHISSMCNSDFWRSVTLHCVHHLQGEYGRKSKSCCVSTDWGVRHGNTHAPKWRGLWLRSDGDNVQAYFAIHIWTSSDLHSSPLPPHLPSRCIHQNVGDWTLKQCNYSPIHEKTMCYYNCCDNTYQCSLHLVLIRDVLLQLGIHCTACSRDTRSDVTVGGDK
jgi:hypothetical protein